MMVDISPGGILLRFDGHLDNRVLESMTDFYVFKLIGVTNVDSLTPLLIVVLIPLYLCLLRPFIHNHIPGMLKRIGLGMIFILLSTMCASVMTILMATIPHLPLILTS